MRWTLEEAARGAGFGPHLCPNQSRQDTKHATDATEGMGGMVRILDDEQLRRTFVKLYSLPSKRTLQTRVGASDLANLCDRDVAYALAGIKRRNPNAERCWLPAENGTGIHAHSEERINFAHSDELTPEEKLLVAEVVGMAPGLRAERHVYFGHINGYGAVGGTIDLDFEGQIGDIKGSDWDKTATLLDWIASQRGVEHRFWVHKKPQGRRGEGYELKGSRGWTCWRTAAQHQEAIAKIQYKMDGYFGQQSLYLLGREEEGRPADRGSIIWVNRDGNGYFDVPDMSGWDDPKRKHDINILTFAYNRQYAMGLMNRAQRIWDQLQRGMSPSEFPAHDLCWSCGHEEKAVEALGNLDAPVIIDLGGVAA